MPAKLSLASTLAIESSSDQYHAKCQSGRTQGRRNDVRRAFCRLQLEIPDFGHVFGLLSGEYGDRKTKHPKKDEDSAGNH